MVPLRLSATPLWTQSSFSAALVDQNLLSIYPLKPNSFLNSHPIGFLFRDKEQPLLEHWYLSDQRW